MSNRRDYTVLIRPAAGFMVAGVIIALGGHLDDASVRSACAWGIASSTIETAFLWFKKKSNEPKTTVVAYTNVYRLGNHHQRRRRHVRSRSTPFDRSYIDATVD